MAEQEHIPAFLRKKMKKELTGNKRLSLAPSASEAPPVDESELLTQGYLMKRGGGSSTLGRKNWKRRYFKIDRKNHRLVYYANYGPEERAAGKKIEVKGVIKLEGAVVERNSKLSTLKFSVEPVQGKHAVYYLQADSAEEVQSWVVSLQHFAKIKQKSVKESSTEVVGGDETEDAVLNLKGQEVDLQLLKRDGKLNLVLKEMMFNIDGEKIVRTAVIKLPKRADGSPGSGETCGLKVGDELLRIGRIDCMKLELPQIITLLSTADSSRKIPITILRPSENQNKQWWALVADMKNMAKPVQVNGSPQDQRSGWRNAKKMAGKATVAHKARDKRGSKSNKQKFDLDDISREEIIESSVKGLKVEPSPPPPADGPSVPPPPPISSAGQAQAALPPPPMAAPPPPAPSGAGAGASTSGEATEATEATQEAGKSDQLGGADDGAGEGTDSSSDALMEGRWACLVCTYVNYESSDKCTMCKTKRNKQAEHEKAKYEKEKAEKLKAEKEKAEKLKAEKEKAEKDKTEKEKAEKEKAEKEEENGASGHYSNALKALELNMKKQQNEQEELQANIGAEENKKDGEAVGAGEAGDEGNQKKDREGGDEEAEEGGAREEAEGEVEGEDDTTDDGAAVTTESEWEEFEDDEHSKYYYNSSTGETRWTKPEGWTAQPMGDGAGSAAADADAHAGNWEVMKDEEDGTPYYYNRRTDETTWEMPMALQARATSADDDAWEKVVDDEDGTYYHNRKTSQSQWEVPAEWTGRIVKLERVEGEEKGENEEHWEELEDPQDGTYYYNKRTGETVWERPAVLQQSKQAIEAEQGATDAGDAAGAEAEAEAEAEATNVVAKATDLADPEKSDPGGSADAGAGATTGADSTEDWEAVVDADNNTYYYNRKTSQTSWEPPAELQGVVASAPDADAADGTGDWEAVVDADNNTYYYNRKTSQTSWEPPAELQGVVASAPDADAADGTGDWEAVVDADNNTYYYNRKTSQTSWEPPAELQALVGVQSACAPDADAGAGATAGAVVTGDWEAVVDADNNTYYYNRKTRQTSWEPPVELQGVVASTPSDVTTKSAKEKELLTVPDPDPLEDSASKELEVAAEDTAEDTKPCSNYELDLAGASFGICKCGFPKREHENF